MKKIVAKASFVHLSPRKLRLVADAVRKLSVSSATAALANMPKRAAAPIFAVLQQAVANAKNNFKLSPAALVISSLVVEEGPRMKRRDVHAHGARFDSGMRHKKLAHIKVILEAPDHGTKS